jgi:hypothetical protein
MPISVSEVRRLLQLLPPGSDKARAKGCTCPVLDNGHGNPELGITRGWVINETCPLHAVNK